jgi:hypothetical protein
VTLVDFTSLHQCTKHAGGLLAVLGCAFCQLLADILLLMVFVTTRLGRRFVAVLCFDRHDAHAQDGMGLARAIHAVTISHCMGCAQVCMDSVHYNNGRPT